MFVLIFFIVLHIIKWVSCQVDSKQASNSLVLMNLLTEYFDNYFRYNSTYPTSEMTAESAHEALKLKCHRQWKDLAQVSLIQGKKCLMHLKSSVT